jgi:hypothetical protein
MDIEGLEVELQRGVRRALANHANLALALRSSANGELRIYDDVPTNTPLPYVTIGDDDVNDESTTCSKLYEANVTVHVWTEADGQQVGKGPAKTLGGYVRQALDTEITIDGYIVQAGYFVTAVYRPGPTPKKTEGVLTFTYLIDAI